MHPVNINIRQTKVSTRVLNSFVYLLDDFKEIRIGKFSRQIF